MLTYLTVGIFVFLNGLVAPKTIQYKCTVICDICVFCMPKTCFRECSVKVFINMMYCTGKYYFIFSKVC